jgi:MFS transporter, PPP family, 3-phenylpropionic acid transporter
MRHDSASAAGSFDLAAVFAKNPGRAMPYSGKHSTMRANSIFGFVPRLAMFYSALFILPGIQMPFFPVWLNAKNVDPKLIGIVLAVPMVARVLAIPVVTRQADRRDAVRAALVLGALGSVVGLALVGLSAGVAAILVAYVLTSLASTPMMPLAETYALKGLAARGRAYGPVRLWGSFAYIGGNFAAGFAADVIPARHLIWLMVAASVLIAFAALLLPPTKSPAENSEAPAVRGQHLLRNRAFLAVIAAASLIQASHALFYGFSAVQWHAAGLDGTVIAALWALGVAAEIVLFAMQSRLPPFFEPTVLLMVGACGGALRWAGMSFDLPTSALAALQLLHALSFGATHLGALMMLARFAPPGQAATAQGYLAIALGLAMAAAMAISGVLYEDFGGRAYAAMTLMAIAGGACGFVAHRMRREMAR